MAIETSYAKVEWKDGVVAEGISRGFKVTMDEPVEDGGTNTAMNPVK